MSFPRLDRLKLVLVEIRYYATELLELVEQIRMLQEIKLEVKQCTLKPVWSLS